MNNPTRESPLHTSRRNNRKNKHINRRQPLAATWKVYALLNHDLRQIFVGASDRPVPEMAIECTSVAREIVDWEATRHDIESIELVESFPNLRAAKMYAAWLQRDGAFEGVEDYVMGLDAALA